MSEVSQGFEAAMRRGRELGAAGDWTRALTEFIRAAQIAPTDISARYHLAYALMKLRHYDQAMQQFQGVIRNQPQNTDTWQRIAEILHLTGKTEAAVQTYRRALELHKKNERYREAAEVLRAIIQTNPGEISAYRELMDMYKARGDRKNAALLATRLGHYHLSQTRLIDARSAVREALNLFPGLPEAEELRNKIGTTNNLPVAQPEPAAAGNLVADQSPDEFAIKQLIATAEEALAKGDTGLALRNYEMAVEAGANRADVFYSVGQLYAETGQVDQAADYLRRATTDHDYAASAFFSIGQVYHQAGRLDEAAHAYRDALNMIDMQTIGRDEIDELVDMYTALGDVLEQQDRQSELQELYNRLAGFINNRNLRTEKTGAVLAKAREINERLRPVAGNGQAQAADEAEQALFTSSIRFGTDEPLTAPADRDEAEAAPNRLVVAAPIGSFAAANGAARPAAVIAPVRKIEARFPAQLIELEPLPVAQPYVRAAEQFLKTQRLYAASDACQEMIRYFPDYLPAQAMLAEVLVAQSRLEAARAKYQYIVDTYQLRQQPDRTIECYRRLSELSPDNLGLHTKLANMLLQYNYREEAAEVLLATISNFVSTGQLERALDECKKLKVQAPQSAPVRVQYAELLVRLERFEEAQAELRQALELDPRNLRAQALLNISDILANKLEQRWESLQAVIEQADEAGLKSVIEDYQQAQLLFNHPGLSYALACLLIEAHQGRQAVKVLKQAIEQRRNSEFEPLLRWQLGEIYLEMKDGQSAVEQLEQAARLIENSNPAHYADSSYRYGKLPSQVWVYCKLANAYEAQGTPEQAIRALRTVKKMMPYNRAIHKQLAELNFNQGQLAEALAELNELATHYEETGKDEEMISVLREMVELAPNNISARDRISEVFLKRGMIVEGLKELDELAELQRKNGRLKDAVRTLQRAAETYWMLGQTEPAYELYERIVRISPGDVEARQQLVNRHLMAGRTRDAGEEQRTIAQICLQANNLEGAVAALHQLISLVPDDTRAYFQLASLLASTGQYGEAFRLYEKVLQIEPGNEKARNLMDQAQRKAADAGQLTTPAEQPGYNTDGEPAAEASQPEQKEG